MNKSWWELIGILFPVEFFKWLHCGRDWKLFGLFKTQKTIPLEQIPTNIFSSCMENANCNSLSLQLGNNVNIPSISSIHDLVPSLILLLYVSDITMISL